MISEERVVLMTKAAILEQNHQKELNTNRFYRKEYVVYHFVMVWLCITIAFFAIGGGAVALYIEEMPEKAQYADWMSIAYIAGLLYIFLVAVYALLCLIIYGVRYSRGQAVVKQYNGLLRQLERLYTEEAQMLPKYSTPPTAVGKKVIKKKQYKITRITEDTVVDGINRSEEEQKGEKEV